jgi:hypothetical protein
MVLCESGNYSRGIRNDNCHLSCEILLISTCKQDYSVSYANNTESGSPAADGRLYRGANLLRHIHHEAFSNNTIVFINMI